MYSNTSQYRELPSKDVWLADLAVFVISVPVRPEISSEDAACSLEERTSGRNQLMEKRLCAKLYHSTGCFFATCEKCSLHIQWMLVFRKQDNCNSGINYHTVLISQSTWITWDPKWPWKSQVNLENPIFVPRTDEPAQNLMDANWLGGLVWDGFGKCGKWQVKSKDFLNTEFLSSDE